jgi:hypothetical protein
VGRVRGEESDDGDDERTTRRDDYNHLATTTTKHHHYTTHTYKKVRMVNKSEWKSTRKWKWSV